MFARPMFRDLLIALSLANLTFFRVWRELLQGKLNYYSKVPPTSNLLGVMLNVLILAAIFSLLITLARRAKNPGWMHLARWSFLLYFLLNLRITREAFSLYARHGWAGMAFWVTLFLIVLYLIYRWEKKLAHGAAALLLIASPFVLVTFGQASWMLYKSNYELSFKDEPTAPLLPPKDDAPHIVWVIYDEFDQRMAFEIRPKDVEMPAFDRIRNEALVASSAYPPGRKTELSLPALITGKLISDGEPAGSEELVVTIDDREKEGFSEIDNIFTETRQFGLNTSLSGWHHPYCRLLTRDLTRCFWEAVPLLRVSFGRGATLGDSVVEQFHDVMNTLLNFQRLGWLQREAKDREKRSEKIDDHLAILQHGTAAATDPSYGLTLIHLPVPHPPGIYDRQRNDYAPGGNYLDSLEATDRTLLELRNAMEQAGLWDRSIVILSSDHWWRGDFWKTQIGWTAEETEVLAGKIDHRVPFIVKMPGQKAGLAYSEPFNTVLTADLISAMLRKEVQTPEQVAAWITQHKTIADSPYNKKKED
jgi:hypothetical protein